MLEALQGYSPVGTSSSHAQQQQQTRRRRLLVIGGGVAFLLVLLSGSHYARSGSSATFSEYYGASYRASSSSTGNIFSERKVKILHLIDKATEESTMDRWFMRSQQEFAMATDLVEDAPIWGKGWDGYSEEMSLVENVKRQYGRPDYFDAVLAYYNGDQDNHLGVDPAPRFLQIAELSRQGTIIMDRPHEMRDLRRVPMYDLANVSIVLAPYAHELFEYKKYVRQALLVHQPHPVEPRLFEHDVNGPKEIDVLLAGSLEAPMYPLRHRLGELINEKKIPGYIRPHPGYPDILSAVDRERLGINEAFMEKQLMDFSNDLGKSKICFVTASRWQYSIQKFGEAAAAGCMMIGTLPIDRRDDFAKFVVQISNDDTDEHIRQTVQKWLDDDAGRIEKARLAQEYFLSKFSGRNFVEDIVGWIKMVQSGRRGMMLPYQWDFLPDPLPMDG